MSQKILRGLRESRKKGQYCGGHVPYGYNVINKKIHIDEDKAAVVRYIYEQYSVGVYVPKIICKLNQKGLLHCGKPFIPNTVYGILKNERYLGIYKIKDEVFDNIYPQIVPTEIFESVRKKIDKNKFGKRSVKTVYLFRHKLKCGYCGHPISAECGTARHGQTVHYYKCSGRKKFRNGCEKTALRKDAFEEFMLDNILKEMNAPETIENIVDGIMSVQERQLRENSVSNILLREQKQTETMLNNLMAAIEQGIYSNTTNKRLHELETKQQELEQKIAVEKSKSVVMLSRAEIRKYYESALRLEPQLLINYLIKEIVMYNNRIEIHYNSPIKMNADMKDSFSFYIGTVEMPVMLQNRQEPDMRELSIEMSV